MPKVFKNWRDASKANWGTSLDPELETLNADQIKTGALLRIADAVETVAKDRIQMEKSLKYYKDAFEKSQAEVANLNHKISGYKSHITRLKNRLNS
jgi:predicted RNase H-like nuclease (RuvC/YqgF family)